MQALFLILFGVAAVVVGHNQYLAMVGDYESAILGWAGFALPFGLCAAAYCLGRVNQMEEDHED